MLSSFVDTGGVNTEVGRAALENNLLRGERERDGSPSQ